MVWTSMYGNVTLPHKNNYSDRQKIGAGGDENLVIYFMWPNSFEGDS